MRRCSLELADSMEVPDLDLLMDAGFMHVPQLNELSPEDCREVGLMATAVHLSQVTTGM